MKHDEAQSIAGDPQQSMQQNVRISLREALDSGSIVSTLFAKSVPQHRSSAWYYVGGLTMFCFAIQIFTGILLLTYFEATNNVTMRSLEMIIRHVPFGWLVRSLHAWGATFAIFFTFVHMFSSFFMKSYRSPRIVLWITGVALLAVMLGFGYTGYLLPEMHGIDLRRYFALHVTVLPLTALLIVLAHVSLAMLLGTSVPIGAKVRTHTRFFPDYMLGEAIVWLFGFVLLLLVAWFYPWEFNGAVSVPKGATVIGVRADWYLLWISQLERPFPGSLGTIVIAVVAIFWAAIPFLDRKALNNQKSPLFTWIGAIVLALLVSMTALAYFSVPQEKANTKLGQNADSAAGHGPSPRGQSPK